MVMWSIGPYGASFLARNQSCNGGNSLQDGDDIRDCTFSWGELFSLVYFNHTIFLAL